MKRWYGVLSAFLLLYLPGAGQAVMTLEEALSLALKQNYDIRVARSSADIDAANNTAGNAGMLPSIGVSASDQFSYDQVSSTLASGATSTASGARVNNLSSDLGLSWTLFNGGKMFVTRNKLRQINELGEIQFREQVDQTVSDIILAYYDVVRQKQQLASIREVIRYNTERVTILEASFRAGMVPKTDLLQSQVDLNVFTENAIIQETVVLASKRKLNQLICRDAETAFEVTDSIRLDYTPNRDDFREKIYSRNTQVLGLQKQADISALTVREMNASRWPGLSLSAGYGYSLNTNTAGSVTRNQVFGPSVGGSLSWSLFNGGNINRQVRVARLQEQSARFALESVKTAVNTRLQNALSDYDQAVKLMELEKGNTLLAKENLTISLDRLRLGQTTALEVRQAEESYIQSLTRYIQFAYTAKLAETTLRQLVSNL
ncbi:MAG TPA: TolC family protein [Bacteroidales bacterium]|nr:TolC family protein [Bacteroidales bacterium]HPS63332.1 TolC family protein [Bacteroidales bacterium]